MSILFTIGLIFPLLSWVTFLLSLYERKAKQRHASPVYIPFVGPVAIDIALLGEGAEWGWLALPWVLDIGTLAFLRVMPQLLRTFWQIADFNRVGLYKAAEGMRGVTLSLYKAGVYQLSFAWDRPKGETGMTGAGEPGEYVVTENGYILTAHTGAKRILSRSGDLLQVASEDAGIAEHLCIKGLQFGPLDKSKGPE